MHTDKRTIQKSVKAYLSLVLHMKEHTQVVHMLTQSLKQHVTVAPKNNTENIKHSLLHQLLLLLRVSQRCVFMTANEEQHCAISLATMT